jgi:hypothetical protein
MAKPYNYTDCVPEYLPHVVFDHGTNAANLPTIGELEFNFTGGRITPDATFGIGLSIAGKSPIDLEGQVTEFVENRRVAMEVAVPGLGRTCLRLDLRPDEFSGTEIDYEIRLSASGLLAIPAIALIKRSVPAIAADYKQKIMDSIRSSEQTGSKHS